MFSPGDTRPLNISNVDNRLLASAARIAWEPTLDDWISEHQRGFLGGRNMMHNLIDVDLKAMTVSQDHPDGAMILFDFKAAFPSVSHAFLLRCLGYIGLPREAINFVSAMYSHNRCKVRVQGGDFPGFHMEGGLGRDARFPRFFLLRAMISC